MSRWQQIEVRLLSQLARLEDKLNQPRSAALYRQLAEYSAQPLWWRLWHIRDKMRIEEQLEVLGR